MRLHLLGITLLCAGQFLANSSQAEPKHGLSVFGDLKYPATFSHFDYVNPDAPKGGRMALIGPVPNDTFDSFNGYILKGDPAQGFALMFDTLMERAMDEPDAVYGLVAKTADLATDRKSVVFELRTEAKFADGTGLTSEDVCDSFRLLSTLGHENIRLTIKDVEACEALADGRRKGRNADNIRPGYRKLSVGSHVLFFRVTGGGEIDVVRILHQRMDVAGHFED